MHDAAIEVAVATFLARSHLEDDGLTGLLEEQGVEPWLAARLTTFLPVAFGRKLLRGVTLSPDLMEEGVTRPLEDDPVYLAALARAEEMTRDEAKAIGLRSS
jgi:hypothetical protein